VTSLEVPKTNVLLIPGNDDVHWAAPAITCAWGAGKSLVPIRFSRRSKTPIEAKVAGIIPTIAPSGTWSSKWQRCRRPC
jgi:hypothetical protein